MFYQVEIRDRVRVPPIYFDLEGKEAVLKSVRNKYEGVIDPEMGLVVDVFDVSEVDEGVIIPGDGAAFYDSVFTALAFKPELQELVVGRVKDITDFAAFLMIGPIDGMIHIGQTMDDYVSFSKEKVLQGKESGRVLKVGDLCRARVIAVSFKDITNPRIGLTMRQAGLGKMEWLVVDEKTEGAKK